MLPNEDRPEISQHTLPSLAAGMFLGFVLSQGGDGVRVPCSELKVLIRACFQVWEDSIAGREVDGRQFLVLGLGFQDQRAYSATCRAGLEAHCELSVCFAIGSHNQSVGLPVCKSLPNCGLRIPLWRSHQLEVLSCALLRTLALLEPWMDAVGM